MTERERTCAACGRVIDMAAGEALHYPCSWGCSGELRRLRETKPDEPICIDCLPDQFKRGGPGWTPILSAADLPKIGDPLPPNVIVRKA